MPMACSCVMTVTKSRIAVLVMAISIAVVIVMVLNLRVSTGPIFMSPSSVKNSKSFSLIDKSSSRHNGNSSTPKGYIITDHFRGQQGGSMRAVLSLQCWAASFSLPVKIVDPYVGIKKSRNKMSELFDLEHFNAVSQQTREPLIATWEEFSNQSPRDVIVVDVNLKRQSCESDRGLFNKELDVNNSNASTSSYSVANEEECLNLKHLGMKVPVLGKFNYCIKRVVTKLSVECCSKSPSEYKEMINIIYRGRDVTKFTVVFTWWSAMCECQNPDSFYHIKCSDPLKQKFKNRVTTSKQLLSYARYYTEHFLHSQNKVAVMIRSEQAVMRFREKGDKIELLRDCLQRTVSIMHNISETDSHNGGTGILLTTDVGRFGTLTGNSVNKVLKGRIQEMTELVKQAFASIYNDEWTFEDYEKSFTISSKGNESPVYIAALQRTLASQADCLILMGGGNFQLLALNDYLEKHPNPCVHFVCLDKFNEEVTRLAMQQYN